MLLFDKYGDDESVQSCLLQLEKILKAQIDGWEQEHSREFLVSGRKFLEYVQEQWDGYQSEKEKEKLERVGFSDRLLELHVERGQRPRLP